MAPRMARLLGVCGIAAALSVGGCGEENRQTAKPNPNTPAVTKLATPNAGAPTTVSQRSRFDSAATDLQSLFDELGGSGSPSAAPADSPVTLNSAPAPAQSAAVPAPKPDFSVTSTAPAAATAKPAAPSGKADSRRVELVAQLATLLKPGPGKTGASEPVRAALPLIALDLIQPGAADDELAALTKTLSPEESATIAAVRDLVRQLAVDSQAAGDRAALARLLERQADRLSAQSSGGGLALGTVALCQRVESYGRFTPFAANRFLAGRPIAMIVYTEVENFAQTPSGATSDETYTVEMGQELDLYLDNGGMLQWRQPELVVRDVSKSKRRDYYLVQRIELPANLSVGKYNLKVIVRDKSAAGGRGAEAETNIPIQIVADAALLGASEAPKSTGQPGKPLSPAGPKTTREKQTNKSP